MLATLSAHGDCVLISRYYRRGRDIQVGDVVNYKHPLFPWMGAIKRVGGMPGDLVCRGGQKGEGGRMIQVRGYSTLGRFEREDGGADEDIWWGWWCRCLKVIAGC